MSFMPLQLASVCPFVRFIAGHVIPTTTSPPISDK